MPVRSTITTLFQEVAREQRRQLVTLTDELKLLESDLDSLRSSQGFTSYRVSTKPWELQRALVCHECPIS